MRKGTHTGVRAVQNVCLDVCLQGVKDDDLPGELGRPHPGSQRGQWYVCVCMLVAGQLGFKVLGGKLETQAHRESSGITSRER